MEIIRIVISCLTIISVSWIIGYIGANLRQKAEEKHHDNILKVPKLVLAIGLVEAIACYVVIVCIYVFAFNEENVAWSIGYFLMSCLGVWIVLYALNWRITMQEDSFTFKNMFGKKTTYKYQEITAVKHIKIGGYRVYIGKKSIAVDFYILGRQLLWDKIKVMDIPIKE